MLIAVCILLGLSGICYAQLLKYIVRQWKTTEEDSLKENVSLPYLSVIVAARNEEAHIAACLQSIADNSYPSQRYEILLVDDNSTDSTATIVSNLNLPNLHYLNLADTTAVGSKKTALAYAATLAKGDIWLYTDADCQVPEQWLWLAAKALGEDTALDILLGAVDLHPDTSLLNTWQRLDTIGMMAVTNAGIKSKHWHLANGANLAIRRAVWDAAGYSIDTEHKHASGDDVSLVQTYARQHSDKIHFLLNPGYVVKTSAAANLTELVNQRLRWTSKNTTNTTHKQTLVMAIPFVFSLGICMTMLLGVWFPKMLVFGLGFLVAKAIHDTVYLGELQAYFSSKVGGLSRFLLSPVHTLYVAIFGLVALFPFSYSWKGRKVR